MLFSQTYNARSISIVMALCYTALTFGVLIATITHRLQIDLQLPTPALHL